MLMLKTEILLAWWSNASVNINYRYLSAYVSISVAAVAAIGVYIGYASDVHLLWRNDNMLMRLGSSSSGLCPSQRSSFIGCC